MTKTQKCYCGSSQSYEKCCKALHEGKAASSPEELMRARYSAFALADVDYILNTHHPKTRNEQSREDIQAWAEGSTWEKLEILSSAIDKNDDSKGTVEFLATYSTKGTRHNHHEQSDFEKINDQWYFKDGKMVDATYKRESPRVGRNDPCPCGSGKKFKKCCCGAS